MSPLSNWVKDLFVKFVGLEEEIGIFVHICWPWFVQDVVADDIRVRFKSIGYFSPEVKHLVKKAILVAIKSAKGRGYLWSGVHVFKAVLLTLCEKR